MIDAQLIFDGTLTQGGGVTGVAISASATTQASANVIDLGVIRDVGAGEPLGVHVDITVSGATTNSATLEIALQVGATASTTTWKTIINSPHPIAAAQLIAGAPLFRYSIPPLAEIDNATAGVPIYANMRAMRLLYTVGTGVFTGLAVFAYINPRQDRNVFFAPQGNYTASVNAGEL